MKWMRNWIFSSERKRNKNEIPEEQIATLYRKVDNGGRSIIMISRRLSPIHLFLAPQTFIVNEKKFLSFCFLSSALVYCLFFSLVVPLLFILPPSSHSNNRIEWKQDKVCLFCNLYGLHLLHPNPPSPTASSYSIAIITSIKILHIFAHMCLQSLANFIDILGKKLLCHMWWVEWCNYCRHHYRPTSNIQRNQVQAAASTFSSFFFILLLAQVFEQTFPAFLSVYGRLS